MGENERTEWADLKNSRNIEQRQIDFSDLDEAFDGRFAVIVEAMRRDYSEQRFNMLVEVRDMVLNITFTPRSPRHRIISVRLASRKERKAYHAKQQGA